MTKLSDEELAALYNSAARDVVPYLDIPRYIDGFIQLYDTMKRRERQVQNNANIVTALQKRVDGLLKTAPLLKRHATVIQENTTLVMVEKEALLTLERKVTQLRRDKDDMLRARQTIFQRCRCGRMREQGLVCVNDDCAWRT